MHCLGKGTQVPPSPILDYRAALCGRGVESSEVPSWAAEEGNTTAIFTQRHYSQGRTAGVILARSETITAIKIFTGHYHKRHVFKSERWTIFINITFMETQMFFLRHRVSWWFFARVASCPKRSKASIPQVPKSNLQTRSTGWAVLLHCEHSSNNICGVCTFLLTHLIHYSIFLFYTFRSRIDIW